MTSVTGTLDRHTRQREAWAVGVLHVSSSDGDHKAGDLIMVVGGMLGMVAPGEFLELEGEDEDTDYGPQFRISRQASRGIQTAWRAARFLQRIESVGPVLAKAIHARFGCKIIEVLNAEVDGHDPLTDVEGIGNDRAQSIRENWAGVGAAGNPEELRYLDGLGCTNWLTTQIIKHAKKRCMPSRKLLEAEPYSLLEVHGLGFSKVDSVARSAGCSPEAPARLEAGLLHVLGEKVEKEGHTSLVFSNVCREAAEALNVPMTLCMDACRVLAARGDLLLDRTQRPMRVSPAELVSAAQTVFAALVGHGDNEEDSQCSEPREKENGGEARPMFDFASLVRKPDEVNSLLCIAAEEDEDSPCEPDLLPHAADHLVVVDPMEAIWANTDDGLRNEDWE